MKIEKKIENHISIKSKNTSFLELSWYDKRFIYITELGIIMPKLFDVNKNFLIGSYSNMNNMIEEKFGKDFIKGVTWSHLKLHDLTKILSKKMEWLLLKKI